MRRCILLTWEETVPPICVTCLGGRGAERDQHLRQASEREGNRGRAYMDDR